MRVRVDSDICATTGQCTRSLPELFREADDGTSEVVREDVPPDLLERARTAVRHCPVEAIVLVPDSDRS